MKCIHCRQENINKANYCKKCGYHFSKKEQEIAYNKTIVGKIKKAKKWKSILTLKAITDHILFKIVSLLFIIGVGIMIYYRYGNEVKILESKYYQVQYNTKLKEYYLLIDQDQVTLNLYKPNDVTDLKITHFDIQGQTLEEISYKDVRDIILYANMMDDYYVLEAKTSSKLKLEMKIYVFRKDYENE